MECNNCGVVFQPSGRQVRETQLKPNRLVFCGMDCYKQFNKSGLVVNTGRFVTGGQTGANNPKWKGENAGYYAKHDWVIRQWGQPQMCEHCDAENLGSRKHQWANISGEYKRNRADWLRLCAKCHFKFDGRDKNFTKFRSKPIRKLMKNNKSGFKNVSRTPYGTYRAFITIDGKQLKLGSYTTPQEAFEMYKRKAIEIYGYY